MPAAIPPTKRHTRRARRGRGQSLVEFAISAGVLVLLFGGLVDLTRAFRTQDTLQLAAREGARYGASYNQGTAGNTHFKDADIKAAVDAELNAGGLPASIQKGSLSSGCGGLAVTDGNTYFNPPYATASFPAAANQPWLYVCTVSGSPGDLVVALLMTYGPLTQFLPTGAIPGGFAESAAVHAVLQP